MPETQSHIIPSWFPQVELLLRVKVTVFVGVEHREDEIRFFVRHSQSSQLIQRGFELTPIQLLLLHNELQVVNVNEEVLEGEETLGAGGVHLQLVVVPAEAHHDAGHDDRDAAEGHEEGGGVLLQPVGQVHAEDRAANDPSVFTITEKAPTRAFFWSKTLALSH